MNLIREKKQRRLQDDFWWGASLDAKTSEGDKAEDGKTLEGIDFLHRYQEDIVLMKEMDLKVFYMIPDFNRIFPQNASAEDADEDALRYYVDLFRLIKENGIDSVVKIEGAQWELSYCKVLFKRLKGIVNRWILDINPVWEKKSLILGHEVDSSNVIGVQSMVIDKDAEWDFIGIDIPLGEPEFLVPLKRLWEQSGLPILITQCGFSHKDCLEIDGNIKDDYRVEYLREALEQVKEAVMQGVNVRGFCVYSLLDVVHEKSKNISNRTGLIYVDRHDDGYGSLIRKKKKSYDWYKGVIQTNGMDL